MGLAVGGAVAALALTVGLGAASAAPRTYRTVVRITCNSKASARTYAGRPLYACTARAYSAHNWSKRIAVVYVGNHTFPTSRAVVRASFRGDRVHRASSATAHFVILRKALSYQLSIGSRPYDGTTSAPLSGCALSGVVARDIGHVVCSTAGVSATFSQPGIGTQIPVTVRGNLALTGSAAKYYIFGAASPQTVLAADITAEPLIVDTDLYSDAGDAGALAIADALQLSGEAKLVGTMLNTGYNRKVATDTVGCAAAIQQYYGVTDGQFGADTTAGLGGGDTNVPPWAGNCAATATAAVPTPISAVTAYRRALAGQPDHSVVIASIGYFDNLAALLRSGPDAASPLSGAQLVAQKVRELVAMDGCFPAASATCGSTQNSFNNAAGNAAAASYVAANWPTKVVWSGYEFGSQVKTGQSVTGTLPSWSPLYQAYSAFAGPNNFLYSYDLATVYYAVRPWDSAIALSGPGTNTISTPSGANTYTATPAGKVYYMDVNASNISSLDASIEKLLDTVPTGPAPNDSFGSGSINSTLWKTATTNPPVAVPPTPAYTGASSVQETGGQLVISHTGTGWTTGSIATQLPYDISGKSTSVQLVQAANGGQSGGAGVTGGETAMRITSIDGAHWVKIDVLGNEIQASSDAGGIAGTVYPYDAATMQYLRISQSGSTWTFDYSPTGQPNTWTPLGSTTDGGLLSPSKVDLQLIAGSDIDNATTDPAPAEFANLQTN